MSSVEPLVHLEHLVPLGRFGALLHRRRVRTRSPLAAIARQSSGRFLPDQLIAIERGERRVTDAEVLDLAGLYDLDNRPFPRAAEMTLVLDRAGTSHMADRGGTDTEHGFDDTLAVASRFVAIAVSVGIDLRTGIAGFEMLAESLDMAPDATLEILEHILSGESVDLAELVAGLESAIAVPQVGLLIGSTPRGELLMAPRPGGSPSGTGSSAAGPLGELMERTIVGG